jgi:predicted RNase H-like nuclease (RuvC/YqgF family)
LLIFGIRFDSDTLCTGGGGAIPKEQQSIRGDSKNISSHPTQLQLLKREVAALEQQILERDAKMTVIDSRLKEIVQNSRQELRELQLKLNNQRDQLGKSDKKVPVERGYKLEHLLHVCKFFKR